MPVSSPFARAGVPTWVLATLGTASVFSLIAAALLMVTGTTDPQATSAATGHGESRARAAVFASPAPIEPRPAPSSANDFPPDLLDSDGVYREALVLQQGADESRTWNVLRQAAWTKRPLTLNLALVYVPLQFRPMPKGFVTVDVPARSADAAEAGLDQRGGAGFSLELPLDQVQPGGPDDAFRRVTGTYHFRYSSINGRDVFRLESGTKADSLPTAGMIDQKRCWTPETLAQTKAAIEADAAKLNADNYVEIKRTWAASPRVWWALRDLSLSYTHDAIDDPLTRACAAWARK